MPVKFIGTIILIAIVGIFCGFNWTEDSRCSINLIFYKTPQIPVFLTIIISFIAGMIVMALFSVANKFSKKEEKTEKVEDKKESEPEKPAPKVEPIKEEKTTEKKEVAESSEKAETITL